MRVAILSDIHGNRSAFEAVLADLCDVSADLVFHGGDLADAGSSPIEIIDRIRDLGWRGVMGNTDEMLVRPETLENFARVSSAPPSLWNAVREMADMTRSVVGEDRLAWLRCLPLTLSGPEIALVHASPESAWRTIPESASDSELESAYRGLGAPIVVFAHTHRPRVRALNGQVQLLINTGSVGLPYDGDTRASYLLLEDNAPQIRRVEYDIEREIDALTRSNLPRANWTIRMLRSGMAQMP